MTATLIATVGLPGSGKTTWAHDQQSEARADGQMLAVVERDSIRDLLGFRWDDAPERRSAMERAVTAAQHSLICQILRSGVDVVASDTNLIPARLQVLAGLAGFADAELRVVPFTDVPLKECIRRDAQRHPYKPGAPCSGASVGEEVIRRMWTNAVEAGVIGVAA